jgi:2-keto-4-pentenoate hydratase/2-oxohepta-3-ene-1,7-dioic acid hydratase in catechol pathway
MRIGSAVIDGNERVVVQGSDGVHATTEQVRMIDVIADWPRWRSELEALAESAGPVTELARVRWLPPVMPEKLICVGTNYSDHVAEMEATGAPKALANTWPYGFFKPPSTALVGHDAAVALPGYAEKIDWEVELALVIGDGSKASGDEPLDAVFGYSVLNDLSVRDYLPFPHALGLDTVVAKGFDGSAPMGPWIVTADEIDDPQNLPLQLRVNGEIKQDSSTSRMIFGVREILAHFSRVLTLRPGDVIATGTPSGVGIARRPPEMLAADDVVEAEIDGIGLLRTTLVRAPDAELLKA